MPVFISHRTADNEIAKHVADRLKNHHGIPVYIDDIDQDVGRARGTPAITALLVQRISMCTNLLAIISQNTVGSWWVPFEIGVARQAPRTITSLTNQGDASLPEYLLEWPRLRGDTAIDTFARIYSEQGRVLTEQVLRNQAPVSLQIGYVEQFHASLKKALGQR